MPVGETTSQSSRCGRGWGWARLLAVVPPKVPAASWQAGPRTILILQVRGPAEGPRAGLQPQHGLPPESSVLQGGVRGEQTLPGYLWTLMPLGPFSRGYDQGVGGALVIKMHGVSGPPVRTHLGPCGSLSGLETASTLSDAGRAILSVTDESI